MNPLLQGFLTGSNVYGKPGPASDLDLVVLVNPWQMAMLRAFAERSPTSSGSDTTEGKLPSESFRFGRLNVLAFHDPVEYAAWKKATDALQARKPVTRDEAVALIKATVKEAIK